jgi:tight adherence protein B
MLTMVLIFLLLALAMFALFTGAHQRGDQARLLRERLTAINRATQRNPRPELALLREEIASSIPALNELLTKSALITRLQDWLAQAAIKKMSASKFLLLCGCVGAVLGVLASRFANSSLIGLVFLFLGCCIPVLVVSIKRRRRFSAFEVALPNAIDMIARAVRVGHAFNSCLEMIATEMPEPLAGEFQQVFDEQKFGLPIRDALLNLSERMPILDVRILVTAIMLQRETGGNLAEILDKLSYIIRERFKILRQARVYTAQGRLTMAILLALPPACAVMMSFIAPDLIRILYTDPMGKALIVAGLMMETIGYLIIRKIVHIRV